jgi:hypothetical protein
MGTLIRLPLAERIRAPRRMNRTEFVLSSASAALLLAAALLVPYSLSGDRGEAPSRHGTRAAFTAIREGHGFSDERITGKPGETEWTVIKPEFPKPVFDGGRFQRKNLPPNIMEGHYSEVREIRIPRRVSLLSRGVPVTSSDPAPLGELSLVTDGDKHGDDGYFVDLLPGQQWIQIDLGAPRELWLLWIWMYHKYPAIYNDVIIELAAQEDFGDARVVFNNDHDDTSGMGAGSDTSWIDSNYGRPLRLQGQRARFIRLYSNGRDLDDTNQWIEVEAYGR